MIWTDPRMWQSSCKPPQLLTRNTESFAEQICNLLSRESGRGQIANLPHRLRLSEIQGLSLSRNSPRASTGRLTYTVSPARPYLSQLILQTASKQSLTA